MVVRVVVASVLILGATGCIGGAGGPPIVGDGDGDASNAGDGDASNAGDGDSGGSTTTCRTPDSSCAGGCTDFASDRDNCGACGFACAPGELCDGAGRCAASCRAGLIVCDGHCIDPNHNDKFCGASGACTGAEQGTACAAGELCDGTGVCSPSCADGFKRCAGVCVAIEECLPCGSGSRHCDPADLSGASCGDLSYGPGTLLCDRITCTYDTSMCGAGMGGMGGTSGGTR